VVFFRNRMRLMLALLPLLLCAAVTASVMSVQVREGVVREKPSFLGKVVRNMNYGDRVAVVHAEGEWRLVAAEGASETEGWMHISALSPRKIVLHPTDTDARTAAESDELALAGKGFNSQVEKEYARRAHMDYAMVDALEQRVVTQDDMLVFVREGNLKGGAQ